MRRSDATRDLEKAIAKLDAAIAVSTAQHNRLLAARAKAKRALAVLLAAPDAGAADAG